MGTIELYIESFGGAAPNQKPKIGMTESVTALCHNQYQVGILGFGVFCGGPS
jgi:hypothetical protein